MPISGVITLWGFRIKVEESNLRLPSSPVASCNWNPTAREIKSKGGEGEREEEARAEKSHLGILFDRYKHSFLEFDVLCCEKVQVRFFLLFSLALLESINFWTGRGNVSGNSVHTIQADAKQTNYIPEIESGQAAFIDAFQGTSPHGWVELSRSSPVPFGAALS